MTRKRFSELSLRARFVWSILFCVGLSLILIGVWAFQAYKQIEQTMLRDVLAMPLAQYAKQVTARDALNVLPLSEPLRLYRYTDPDLPAQLRKYKPGSYRRVVVRDDTDRKHLYQVIVADTAQGRIYLTIDLTHHESRLLWAWAWFFLMLGVTLIVIMLATGWATRNILAPVTELAERLSHIDPRRRGVRIARNFSRNELAPIAASVDRFLERLDGFVEREQSFTATASHELRTPLAVIQGAAEILSKQIDQPAAQKALTRIQRAAGEMSEFTHALLMLSREAQPETEPGEFSDVSEIMLRVVEDQRELLQGRPVHVECLCDIPLFVQAPRSIVTIVVGNLFRNAVAHTKQGLIVCEVTERKLEIRDSGAGIAPEHIAHVFDRNFTTRPGGFGVGLYLSKRICDRYGWHITLQSSSHGTIASVTF